MMNTELMVLPQFPAVRSGEVAELEDDNAEYEYAGESFEEIQEEVEALELRLDADKERLTIAINEMNKACGSEISKIAALQAKIELKIAELAASDDLEDQANAEDAQNKIKDAFEEDDTDHETRDNEADADAEDTVARWSRATLIKKCKAVFKAIARATHPDKCRKLPKEEAQRRAQLFLDAKGAMAKLDYEELEAIHIELFDKSHEPLNLVERLMRARQRREHLRRELEALRQSPEWSLYLLELRHGREVAIGQYRASLEQSIIGLTHMLKELENPGSESYTHWV